MTKERSSTRLNVCLWGGWYGSQNAGDQAILISIAQLLKLREKDIHLMVLSKNATYIERYMKSAGFNVQAVDKWRQLPKTIRSLASANLLAIGGGVPFFDKWTQVLTCAFFVMVAKLFRTPVMTYGVGTQSLEHPLSRLVYKHILNRLDLITVRDPRTLREFEGLGVKKEITLVGDPAFILRPADQDAIDKLLTQAGIQIGTRPLIGITTRQLSAKHGYRREHYRQLSNADIIAFQEAMASAADYLTTLGQVIFIPQHTMAPDDDREMATAIMDRMEHASEVALVSAQYSPSEAAGFIANCSLLLGSRLHSIVFAATHQVPFVGVAYDLKLSGIVESLQMNDYMLDLVGLKAEDLISKLKQVWEERDTIRVNLQGKVTELSHSAEYTADLAIKLAKTNKYSSIYKPGRG